MIAASFPSGDIPANYAPTFTKVAAVKRRPEPTWTRRRTDQFPNLPHTTSGVALRDVPASIHPTGWTRTPLSVYINQLKSMAANHDRRIRTPEPNHGVNLAAGAPGSGWIGPRTDSGIGDDWRYTFNCSVINLEREVRRARDGSVGDRNVTTREIGQRNPFYHTMTPWFNKHCFDAFAPQ